MKIAVEGCGHGELDKIYETITFIEERDKLKVDLLLCCGDFQAVRNKADLICMATPSKYHKMQTFYKYYSGEKKAPVLTVFIGGNHEASSYLQELSYGGWVAPNIYYLGYGNVVQFGGLRIAGLSGIYKGRDYYKGHFEKAPYNEDTKRSVYHVRILEVFRLKQISRPIDIMLSHDWPRGVYHYGNTNRLVKTKKHFKDEIETDKLGSPPAEELLYKLKPSYWFSAHLHVKFAAMIQHKSSEDAGEDKVTRFLALDKCLPRRKFLQILDIAHDPSQPLRLELDPEWLCVLKSTNHLLNTSSANKYMPGPGCSERWDFTVTDEEMKSVIDDFGGDMSIPDNFEQTAPVYDPATPKAGCKGPAHKINPQTSLLCAMLDITDPLSVVTGLPSTLGGSVQDTSINPDEIALDDDDDEAGDDVGVEESKDQDDDDDDDVVSDGDEDSSANYSSFITSFSLENDTLESSCLSTDEDAVPLGSGEDSQSDAPKSPDLDNNLASAPLPDGCSEKNMDSLQLKDSGGQDNVSLDSPSKVATSVVDTDVESEPVKSQSPVIGEPKVKKFKRRNVAMYSITGDDSYS